VVTHQLQVERRTGKVRQSETDVLPLCHATSNNEIGKRINVSKIANNISTMGDNSIPQQVRCTSAVYTCNSLVSLSSRSADTLHPAVQPAVRNVLNIIHIINK